MQPTIRQERERTRIDARLLPKSDQCVALALNEEAGHADGPLVPCALPGSEPRRSDLGDWSGRRDSQILECVPTQEAATDSVYCHAQLQRYALNGHQ